VEVLVCGEPRSVDRLREWLRAGPPQAAVTGVACEALDYQPFEGFALR
jgi:acylphosphatase